MTTAKKDSPDERSSAGAGVPVLRKQAATSARNARNFTRLVISWARLDTLRPIHCKRTKAARAPRAMGVTPSLDSSGTSASENSPVAIEMYPRTAQ